MSECDVCGKYSDCLHPVAFMNWFSKERLRMKIKDEDQLRRLKDIEERLRIEEDRRPYLCHDCFAVNNGFITWYG